MKTNTKNKIVELYKIKNNKLVLVDYGVVSKMEIYAQQGYVAIIA